jgi:hypothetical protein
LQSNLQLGPGDWQALTYLSELTLKGGPKKGERPD